MHDMSIRSQKVLHKYDSPSLEKRHNMFISQCFDIRWQHALILNNVE